MAKKFVRGITDIKTINNQDFDTNNVNDLLSDGEHNYIHRKKKDKSEEYHNLTDNIKTISSSNTDLIEVTNNNTTNNTATLNPKHDAQKEQVLESTRNTITIEHGDNGTSETTKVDTNPTKVLEHTNLLTDYGISKTTSGNTTKLGLEYTKVIDGFDLNSLTSGSVRGNNLKNAPRTGWYFVDTFGDENNAIQNAKELLAPNTSFTRSRENGVWGQWREQVGDKSVIEGKIPKEIGTVNLFKGSRDFSGSDWVSDSGVYAEDYRGVKIFKKQSKWGGRSQYFEVKTGEEYVFSSYVKSSAKSEKVSFFLSPDGKEPKASGVVSYGSVSSEDSLHLDLTDEYKRIAVKIKITSSGWIAPRLERSDTNAYLFFGGYKLERGNIATDYSPAPEDTQEQISKLLAQKQNTITNNTSIGVIGTGLQQLYTLKQTYTVTGGVLKTHVKSVSENTTITTPEEEFNFIVKLNKAVSSVNFTLNTHDTTKFSNIMSAYGENNTVRISGCVFSLNGSTLTVTTPNNTEQNYVITFSDII